MDIKIVLLLAGTSADRNKGGGGETPGCTGWSQHNHLWPLDESWGKGKVVFWISLERVFPLKQRRIKSFHSERLNVVAQYLPRCQRITESLQSDLFKAGLNAKPGHGCSRLYPVEF